MKKLILLILIYASCLYALQAQQCTEATNVNGIAGTGHSNGNIGQSFTACKTGRLASVSAVAGNAGSGFNYIRVEIYSGENFIAANRLLTSGQVHVKANRTTTWNLTGHNLNVVEGQKYTARFVYVSGSPQLKYGTGANAAIDYYPRGRIIGIGQAHHDMFFTAKIDIINTTLTPLDQATSVSRISDIQIQFSRNMVALTGDVSIRDVVANTSETIPVGDLVIDGGLVTIPNSTVLKANTQYEILIPAGVLESTDGLPFDGFGTNDWTFTTNANTIPEVTSTESSITNTSPIPFNIDFSEAVTGFDVTDLMVTNGAASNFSGSGTAYTVDITPVTEGDVTVQVPAAITIEGNDAAEYSLQYDITNPTVTITSDASGTTNRSPIELTIQFSEPVTGFISDFIDLTNAQIATFEGVSNTEFAVSIDANAEGSITVDVPVLAATDLAGNTNDASLQFTIDYEVDLNDGLVSHYPLNTIKFDVISKNDELIDFGGTPIASEDHHGQPAGGFNFSSSILHEATFDNTPVENGFSISTWVRPTSEMGVISAKRVIYEHATSSTLYYEANALRLDLNGTSNQYVYPVVLPANTWVHLLVSVTENGKVYLYLDNIQNDLGAGPGTLTEATSILSLGGASSGGLILNGDMDDFRYYGKALNPIEAFEIFNEPEYLLEDNTIELCENESFTAPDGNVFSEAGTYSYTDPSGDSSPDTFVTLTLNTIPVPDVIANADNLIVCDGNEIVLTGQGADTYEWDNGVLDGEAFIPTVTTTYTVTGTATNGCENTNQVTVQVVPRGFDDESVTTTAPDFCPDGNPFSGTVSTGSSTVGVNYFLRNSADNTVLDGPVAGTGSSLDFNAGTLTETTTFNVYAEKPSASTNSALTFDGSNDFVDIAVNGTFDYANGYTVEAWVKGSLPGASGGHRPLFSIGSASISDIEVYVQQATNGLVVVHDRGETATFGGYTFAVPPNNEWFHLAVTYDGADIKVYYNGIEQGVINGTFAPAGALTKTGGLTMKLGKASNTAFGANGGHFAGQLDEVRVWNSVKTAGELLANKNTCLDGSETDLEYYFRVDDNTGITVTDLVNGTNGTMTNMDAGTDWVASGVDISCLDYFSCTFQMNQEVTIGDQTAPTIIAQDITAQLDATGMINITASEFDDGSSDNCTADANLVFSLDRTLFGCDDIGVNAVTVTATDEAGNEASTSANVTIESYIVDETITIADASLCPGESSGTTVSTSSSQSGVNYYLRNSSDDSIIDGPIEGTGNAIDFETGVLNASTTFNVFSEIKRHNSALDFDGVNDKLATTYAPGSTNTLTIESWIFPRSSNYDRLISNYAGSGTVLAGDIIIDTHDPSAPNGKAIRLLLGGPGNVLLNFSVPNVLASNDWNHMAVAFDNGIVSIFINGVHVGNTTAPFTIIPGSAAVIHLGEDRIAGTVESFNGKMDEVRIWNTARTANEILNNKDKHLAGDEAGLIAYFNFNEREGTIATDLVGGNNGTLTNMDPNTDWVDGPIVSFDGNLCGFEMTTEVSITVEDITDPVAVAQDITIQLDANDNATITAEDINNGSSDNCNAAIILSLDKTTFTCTDLGSNTVTLTVADGVGNTSTATATVTVEDTTAPTAVTQNLTIQLDATGNASIAATDIDNGSSDTCTADNNLILSLDQSVFTCDDLGQNTVTLTVTDESGNLGSETAIVTVEDVTPPTAIAQNIVVQQEADGTVTISASEVNNGSSDTCSSNLVFTLSKNTFNCSGLGVNNVTLTVTDESGNQATANATVTVEDAIAPTISSQNLTAQLDATGNVSIDPSSVNVGTTDNCSSNLTFALSQTAFDCSHIGENIVILSVTDENNNTSTENVTITIEEGGPTVLTQDITIEIDENGSSVITTTDIDNGSSDDCTSTSDLIMTLDVLNFSCEDIGSPNQVTLSVTDLNGNVSTGTALVTVVDVISPTVLTQNISIVLDGNGMAIIGSDDIDNGSSDNCTISNDLTMSLDVSAFDINDLGENTVTLTVTDAHGNIGSGTAIVTVSDKEAQTATFTGVADKTFGDADFTISASINSSLPATFSVNSGGLSITETAENSAVFSITGAGSATIQVSNNGNDTYAPLLETIAINVAKAEQILTIDQITNKSVVAQPFSVNANVNSNLTLDYGVSGPASISGDVITLDGTVGTVTVTVSQAGNNNYNSVSESTSFDVVAQQPQTITFTDVPDLTYGASNQSLSATSSSELAVNFSLISGPAILTGSTLEITGTGTVIVEATQSGNDDFLSADPVQQTFNIGKATLAIKANDQNIAFNDPIPELTFSYDGFVYSEDQNMLTEIPTISTVATVGSNVGTYDIELAGGLADNYEITLINGTLTINQAQAEITITDLEQTEDGSAKSPAVSTVPTGLSYTITYDGSVDAPSVVGSYQVIVTIDEQNYAGSKEVTFNINAVLGIGDESDMQLTIFPNPASSILNIESENELTGKVQIFNVRGLEVINEELLPGKNQIEVSTLPTGLYILIIQDKNTAIIKKQTILINE